MAIPYALDIDPDYGRATPLSPLVRRVIADNPGRFTYTGTGTYLVGSGAVAVVDPGPDDSGHVDAIIGALQGESVTHILITHTHADHSPAAAELQERTGAPVVGFGPHPVADPALKHAATPTTWDALMPTPEELEELVASMPEIAADPDRLEAQDESGDGSFAPDVVVTDGDEIVGRGWTIRAIHTPGHISNHLCYRLLDEQSLFTGDHVMGWSTSVIPSPEGSMADYLASLRLLLAEDDEVFYPTHGPPLAEPHVRPRDFARALLDHRMDRERQILACLADGPAAVPDMVATMYTETPHILHMAAGQSVFSHLVHMCDVGLIEPTDGSVNADASYELSG